jgi:hypothetical protein
MCIAGAAVCILKGWLACSSMTSPSVHHTIVGLDAFALDATEDQLLTGDHGYRSAIGWKVAVTTSVLAYFVWPARNSLLGVLMVIHSACK